MELFETVYGKESVSHMYVLKLFKRVGREEPEDGPRSGWPLAA
jgi:hypothetical protein